MLLTMSNVVNGTIIDDPDPKFDDCSKAQVMMPGKNIGDLIKCQKHNLGLVSRRIQTNQYDSQYGKAICGSTHNNIANKSQKDYRCSPQTFSVLQINCKSSSSSP